MSPRRCLAVPAASAPSTDPPTCQMENMNYEDFLLKPKDKWITKSTTNVYCNLNGLPDIVKQVEVKTLAPYQFALLIIDQSPGIRISCSFGVCKLLRLTCS
ncbi:hypothetical protein LWI29_001038 [Acer saccharum]|uniref:Uncharacterized protein n=1 Tax=Acer saccharum TaxID=4024 RepID=A0AA39SIH9_ACESA|nr:hypothetical protein LWI29_001038 [Acer saccharum]